MVFSVGGSFSRHNHIRSGNLPFDFELLKNIRFQAGDLNFPLIGPSYRS